METEENAQIPSYELGDHYTDFGPVYCETNLSPEVFFKEPVNALSTLTLLIPVVFWFWYLRGKYQPYQFLMTAMGIGFVAFIGNFIYHGFRLHWFFWVLDWAPLAILAIMAAFYSWLLIYGPKRMWYPITLSMVPIVVIWAVTKYVYVESTPLIIYAGNYFITSLGIFFPVFFWSYLTRNYKVLIWLISATTTFVLGLTFRSLDDSFLCEYIPVGTHFLWHIMGGATLMLISIAFYQMSSFRISNPSPLK